MAGTQSDVDADVYEKDNVTMTVHTYQLGYPEINSIQTETIESAMMMGDKDILYIGEKSPFHNL